MTDSTPVKVAVGPVLTQRSHGQHYNVAPVPTNQKSKMSAIDLFMFLKSI